MKLIRFGEPGKEQPGILHSDGTRRDVSAIVSDYNESFFGGSGLDDLTRAVAANAGSFPVVSNDVRLGPPVARPSKIICIGLNYAKHAKETNAKIPSEPVVFFKSTTALVGPNDDIMIPRNSVKTDWEVELAVVIGKRTSYIEEKDAFSYIAGYALHNDVSEREFQIERGGQWVKGKSADTFAPVGPFLATKDEIPQPNDLHLWLTVNGEKKQDSNTSDMIFHVPFLVSYLSQFMTLLPGDIISTGTPSGVGMGHQPPVYLKPGDVVELGVQGLGTSRQHVVAWKR